MRQLSAVLDGRTRPGRDRQPVRRSSYMAGQCEGRIWRPVDRRELRRVLLGARKYEVAGRQPGRREGPLGHVALEVLELLGNLVDYRSGRLEPSLIYLMRRLRRSRDAVVRALANLRRHGFADWLRRFETVEREGPGPRVKQCSNAYRLAMPERARRLLGVRDAEVPLPDDTRAESRVWTVEELPLAVVEDDRLSRLLGELGRRVSERESASRTEPKAKSFP